MTPIQQISKLLRAPENVLLELEQKMNAITGKTGVFEKIYAENQEKVKKVLKELKNPKPESKIIYELLIKKADKNDELLAKFFCQPKYKDTKSCSSVVDLILETVGQKEGFFLSLKKAEELLRLNPPQNILKVLKYKSIDEMLTKEDIWEIFCALRFAEDSHWLNDVFFRPYKNLKRDDFEKRAIKVIMLPEKWLKVGSKFTGKKLHNISHLKELGIVFVIPTKSKVKGGTLELFTLILHYFHEVAFYAKLFQAYAESDNFGERIMSALRGDVLGLPMADGGSMNWRIVQRYLAKDDANDPRLFEPHINPETVHWKKAERNIASLGKKFPGLELNFWDDLDFVGEFFPHNKNSELLISFDLIDSIISLTKKSTVLSKYLYHQQEALWNKIFVEYMGEEKLEKLLRENLSKGYITLR